MNEDKRYIIGIDLGTSNSSVAFIDTHKSGHLVELFPILQEGTEKKLEYHYKLASFCYQSLPGEKRIASLPWQDSLLGNPAREKKRPRQLVSSAKSWLCHPRVDRRQAILPLDALDPSLRISPLEASKRYLNHIRQAWNYSKGQKQACPLEEQEIVLTLPASFDELARSLTLEAAKLAGFQTLHLLEEPQAAFYEAKKNQQFFDGEMILVCDIGGGTSDFTLIEHREGVFRRMYVGKHLLLGGDNMDVFLASQIEKLFEKPLSHEQFLDLQLQAKDLKEQLFSDQDEPLRCCLSARGSSLVASSLSVQVDRKGLEKKLVAGFFPLLDFEQALCFQPRNALRKMGLDFESEAAITRHLAAFLKGAVFPDSVCFNGAAMKPKVFQEAILSCLKLWSGKEIRVIENKSLDYSVAKGACEFGLSKRGLGKGIVSGLSRGYYLAICDENGEKKLLSLLPKGSVEGRKESIDLPLFLLPNQPVSFEMYCSHTRFKDKSGDLISIDEEGFEALPALNTLLNVSKKSADEKVLVSLDLLFNDLGIVEIYLRDQKSQKQWNLQFSAFDLSGSEEKKTKIEAYDTSALKKASLCLEESFFRDSLQGIVPKLEDLLSSPKKDWDLAFLRHLFTDLLSLKSRAFSSKVLAERWWNLLGFFLRPGFGSSLDEFRIKDLWKVFLQSSSSSLSLQQCICARRIAGGLKKGQQEQLAAKIGPNIFKKQQAKSLQKEKAYSYTEELRLFASLELIDARLKEKMADALVDRIVKQRALDIDYWALSRIAGRRLFYGDFVHLLSSDLAGTYVSKLLALKDQKKVHRVLSCLACRSGRRSFDLEEPLFKAVEALVGKDALEQEPGLDEQEQLFGESLPLGLSL